MTLSPREYLLDRFRADALALTTRANSMDAAGAATVAGPDGATSRRMAVACDEVVQLLEGAPDTDDASAAISALTALVPQLEERAAREVAAPPVRAVFFGAATRIREIAAAEAKASLHSEEHARGREQLEDDDAIDDADDE